MNETKEKKRSEYFWEMDGATWANAYDNTQLQMVFFKCLPIRDLSIFGKIP